MDSSTSISNEDYTSFMESLADLIEQTFPYNDGKFGLMLFANDIAKRIPLQSAPASELADMIRAQTRINGATNTEIAMFIAYEEMWDIGHIDETREQRTLIITDGNPSLGQNPCRELPFFLEVGIEVGVIAIGDAATSNTDPFACFVESGQTVLKYEDFQDTIDNINFAVTGEDSACNVTVSPFDGGYTIGDGYIDGYPWFYSANGWQLQYNATSAQWYFAGSGAGGGGGGGGSGSGSGIGGSGSGSGSGGSSTMTIQGSTTSLFPPSGETWTWSTSWSNETIWYYNVVITWSNTSIPTRSPTEMPSASTTLEPSLFPSYYPSGAPVVPPTFAPSTDPTTCNDYLIYLDGWCQERVLEVFDRCANYSTCQSCFQEDVETMSCKMYNMSRVLDATATCDDTKNQRMLILQQATESLAALTTYMRNDSVIDFDPQDRNGENDTLVVPTPAPTDDCSNFIFGANCITDVDLVMIIDSSNSVVDVDYTSLMSNLAAGVENTLDDEDKLGVYLFATGVEYIIEYSQGDMQTKAQVMRDQTRMSGATYTDIVFQTVWDNIWKNSIDNSRNQIQLLVTDGVPSNGHDPCDQLGRLADASLTQFVIAIGAAADDLESSDTDFQCFIDIGAIVIPFSSFLDVSSNALNLFQITDCSEYAPVTPFDGSYSATEDISGGKPTYRSAEGFLLEFFGIWRFTNPGNPDFGVMTCNGLPDFSDTPWPSDDLVWIYQNSTGSFTYDHVEIFCVSTPFPSRSPVFSPPSQTPSETPSMSAPTHLPSTIPTQRPSEIPSVQPTIAPTIEFTANPTASPISCYSLLSQFEDLCLSFIEQAELECSAVPRTCDVCHDSRITEVDQLIQNLQLSVDYLEACPLSGSMQVLMEDLIAQISDVLLEMQESE